MTQANNKKAIANAFSRAAKHYEQFSELQQLSGDYLMSLVQQHKPNILLDAGCGTGWYSRRWKQKGSQVIALDLSTQMLQICQQSGSADTFLNGDIESLPLNNQSVDLTWSNLAIQWCSDIRTALSELYRVTKPGGCIAFSTLKAGSLSELQQAWSAVDGRHVINTFLTDKQINDACNQWPVALDSQTITQTFDDVISAMRSLKGVGATHLHQERSHRVTTRGQLQRLAEIWPQQDGKYLLTWHMVYGVIKRHE